MKLWEIARPILADVNNEFRRLILVEQTPVLVDKFAKRWQDFLIRCNKETITTEDLQKFEGQTGVYEAVVAMQKNRDHIFHAKIKDWIGAFPEEFSRNCLVGACSEETCFEGGAKRRLNNDQVDLLLKSLVETLGDATESSIEYSDELPPFWVVVEDGKISVNCNDAKALAGGLTTLAKRDQFKMPFIIKEIKPGNHPQYLTVKPRKEGELEKICDALTELESILNPKFEFKRRF